MAVLLIFAFISGFITILAPCIWPLLPIVLSSSATGGHKKPLGVTLGILLSFSILTLTISYIIKIIPFDPNILRLFAVVVIGLFGIMLIIPKLSSLLEGMVSRFSGRVAQVTQQRSSGSPNEALAKSGFWPGLITGLALGVVWTPCAGPIFATIATLAATQSVNSDIVLVTIVYVIGIGIPLFLFATLGRFIVTKTRVLSPYTSRIQQVFGVIMLITAVLIFTNYDKVLEANLLNYFPSYSNFITNFETNQNVKNQLNAIKNNKATTSEEGSGLLNANYSAPDFIGITKWLNLPAGSQSLSIAGLKGKVVLVDFWTYTCINCIRTLPHITHWYDKYKDQGFVVIGVHTPEFQFEHDTQNVLNAIKMYNIHYPVAQDNDYATWNNFNNEYWPAEYLIDASGNVRRVHPGEGEYDQTEQAIQLLLKEAGKKVTTGLDSMPDQTPQGRLSPETYLNSDRMEYYYPGGSTGSVHETFSLSDTVPVNSFSLGGEWTIDSISATSGKNAALQYEFFANKVFLVLNPASGQKSQIKIYIDGKLITPEVSGSDVVNGIVTVDTDRLYNLYDDSKDDTGEHTLKIEFLTPGTQAFAFTFG